VIRNGLLHVVGSCTLMESDSRRSLPMGEVVHTILIAIHFFGGWGLVRLAVPILATMNGDPVLSAGIAITVWIISLLLTVSYGGLLPGLNDHLKRPRSPRAEGKMATAPFRCALVFGFFGSTCLGMGGLSDAWLWPIAACLIAAGYFVGRDVRSRVQALRREVGES
jgi:hypothetical protein